MSSETNIVDTLLLNGVIVVVLLLLIVIFLREIINAAMKGREAAQKAMPTLAVSLKNSRIVMASFLKRHRTSIILGVFALVAFIFVDIPQTIRLKALVINALPLDEESKRKAILNLCRAAFSGRGSSVVECLETYFGE